MWKDTEGHKIGGEWSCKGAEGTCERCVKYVGRYGVPLKQS